MSAVRESSDASLADKVVIVTGGARGQGAAEVRLLTEVGAHVVSTDLLADEGAAVADAAGAAFVVHDVSSAADWDRVVQTAMDSHGRIDGLVNNAAIFEGAGVRDTDEATYRRVVEINQIGVYLGIAAVTEPMVAQRSGSIVNVSSVAGLRGFPAYAYTATKHAVTGMTRTAARELGALGIRVNSVHPGVIDTPMLPTDRGENLGAATPLGRVGDAHEAAAVVLFLLSDASSYVNGAQLTVDGGLTA